MIAGRKIVPPTMPHAPSVCLGTHLFVKVSRPGDSEKTFRSSSQEIALRKLQNCFLTV